MRRLRIITTTTHTKNCKKIFAASGAVAEDSICPKGWKLPDNSGSQSFSTLLGSNYYNVSNDTNGYNKINNWPLNFLRTGYYSYPYGYLFYRTSYGYWWSGTSNSATNGHGLRTYSSSVNPQYGSNRGNGFALRCLGWEEVRE